MSAKSLKITLLSAAFLISIVLLLIGLVLHAQCTDLQALLGNCIDPSGLFIAAGICAALGFVFLCALSGEHWN